MHLAIVLERLVHLTVESDVDARLCGCDLAFEHSSKFLYSLLSPSDLVSLAGTESLSDDSFDYVENVVSLTWELLSGLSATSEIPSVPGTLPYETLLS